jgi:intracellular septation protein
MPTFAYDFMLVLLFFITFKFYDIYVATMVAMAGALFQVILTRVLHKKFDNKQLIVLLILLVFGGMTLYFHNPIFIKWKPTLVFWLFGAVFLGSQFIGKQPLIQRIMGHALEGKHAVPGFIWKRLNLSWGLFFIILGGLNTFVAYHYSTETWVNFKLYGVLSALLIFGVAQAFYLARYMVTDGQKK